MTEGTVPPISFSRAGVAAWLLAQSHAPSEGTLNTLISMSMRSETTLNYRVLTGEEVGDVQSASAGAPTLTSLALRWAADGSASNGLDGFGSISIDRLRWGKQGPTVRHSVQHDYLLVRVDRHGSHVGNPFAGAPVERLCKAYDELLHAVVTTPFSVEEALHDYEGLRQDSMYGAAMLTPLEEELLATISEKHSVPIHQQRVRPFALRAWLVYHARLLQQGQSLSLHCWCTCDAALAREWTCHAQSLMGALLWLSLTLPAEHLLAQPCAVAEPQSSQVLAYPLEASSLTSFLKCRAYLARALFYPRSGWIEISVTWSRYRSSTELGVACSHEPASSTRSSFGDLAHASSSYRAIGETCFTLSTSLLPMVLSLTSPEMAHGLHPCFFGCVQR